MKKAFSLAEVLITIIVIGIISAITIQVLFASSQKKALQTSFEKYNSILSQIATQLPFETTDCYLSESEYIKSFILSKLIAMQSETILKSTTEEALFENYSQYTYTGSEANERLHMNCLKGSEHHTTSWGSAYKTILNDGAFLGICSHLNANDDVAESIGYSSSNGVFISIDTNGSKKPNKFGYDIWNFHFNGKTCKLESASTYRDYLSDEEGYGSNSFNAKLLAECSKKITSDTNGFSCAEYAMANKCPDNDSKSYWDCL